MALGVLVVSLGSASLCMQIILVGILLLTTLIAVQRYGCDELYIGRSLEIIRNDRSGLDDRRGIAYVALNLNEKEEEAMISWNLLPMKYNQYLWTRYNENKRDALRTVPQYPIAPTTSATASQIQTV